MTDAGGHPGVRSLLARFENNSQSSTTSPSPRGRSPIPSDNQGTGRPLSKVRASFISVDRTAQVSPILRTASSPIDSSFNRIRSFNSDDFEAVLKSPVSSLSAGSGQEIADTAITNQPVKDLPSVEDAYKQQTAFPSDSGNAKSTESAVPNAKVLPTSRSSAPETTTAQPSQKPTKTVTKRPSSIHVARTTAPAKTLSAQRSPGNPRTPTSPNKPGTVRSSRSTVTKNGTAESVRTATHKASRTTLNTATKTSTRSAHSSMPARENTKLTTSSAAIRNGRSKSPAKSARLPASRTTPALSTAAKSGSGHSLTRKPSTLKKTVNGSQSRATTPTTGSIRKQASRASLPHSSGSDRSHSRTSNTSTKPADDSFLARMMRPTASSANKVHDKVEVKSPPSATRSVRAPRKVPSKIDPRSAHRLMEKTGQGKTKENKSQTVPAEENDSKRELQAAAPLQEGASDKHDVKPQAEIADKPTESVSNIVETSHEESAEPFAIEIAEESVIAPVESSVAPTLEAPVEESAVPEVNESVEQPLEAIPEQLLDVNQSESQEPIVAVPEAVAPEAAESRLETPSSLEPEVAQEPVTLDLPAESVSATSSEPLTNALPTETESQSEDVAAEMEKLTMN